MRQLFIWTFVLIVMNSCGTHASNVDVKLLKKNISNFTDTIQFELKLDTITYDKKSHDLNLKFSDNSKELFFVDNYSMLVSFSQFIFYKFILSQSSDQINNVNFSFAPEKGNPRTLSLLNHGFAEIEGLYRNECYQNTIQFLFSTLYPELIQELDDRFRNVQILMKIPPQNTFFQNLIELSNKTCKDSTDINNFAVFNLISLAQFYNTANDQRMVYLVSELLRYNHVNMYTIDLGPYQERMIKQIVSSGLEEKFDSDQTLVKKRLDLLNELNSKPYVPK